MIPEGIQQDDPQDSGDSHYGPKLDWKRVRQIRAEYAQAPRNGRDLARQYGVSATTISQVIRNIVWVDHSYTPPAKAKLGVYGALSDKLTPQQVQQIRQRYTAGDGSTRSLGSDFNVSAMTISKIIRGILYPDPEYTPPTR